jgi:hypothetical protein
MATSALLNALAIRSSELEHWEYVDSRWLHFWTGMVVVGVALELGVIFFDFCEDLHAFRRATIRSPERPSVKKLIFEVFACALVVIGVAGEFFVARATEDIGTELRIISNERVRIAEEEAGEARERAASAEATAGSFSARIAEARRLTAEAQRETAMLYALTAPRRLDDKQKGDIGAALKPFANRTVTVATYGLDGEGAAIGTQIMEALGRVPISVRDERAGTIVTGDFEVGINVRGPASQKSFKEATVVALRDIGKLEVHIDTAPASFGTLMGGSSVSGGSSVGGGGGGPRGPDGPTPQGLL